MVFGGVENDGGFGESLSIGVAGLGKQGLGGLDVGRDASARGVTSRAGRGKVVGRDLAASGDILDNGLAVNRHGECPTNAHIVKGRLSGVVAVEIGT